jgi:hypothetical protein
LAATLSARNGRETCGVHQADAELCYGGATFEELASMNFTVFLSYSWQNNLHRATLLRALESLEGVEVKHDRENVRFGEPIWRKIRSLLDISDCVVPILTEDSLKSFGVFEELVRAHDRDIAIIPLCDEKVPVKDLPEFLQVNLIRYSDNHDFEDKAVPQLVAHVARLRDQHRPLS